MNVQKLLSEINYSFIRSGGPGGQHANKVSSKAVLVFDLVHSEGLSSDEKSQLLRKLSGKLNKKQQLILTSDQTRSQHTNKQIVTDRLISLLESGLKKEKKRIPTKVSRAQRARRLDSKKKHSQRKSLRQKPKFD